MRAPQDHDAALLQAGGLPAAVIRNKEKILDQFCQRVQQSLEGARAQPRNLAERRARAEAPFVGTVPDDPLGQRLPDASDILQQAHRGGIDVHTDTRDTALDDLIERAL